MRIKVESVLKFVEMTLPECCVQSDRFLTCFCYKSVTLTQMGCHLDSEVSLSTKWFVSFIDVTKLC
jgi:hypothetical protein